MWEVMKLLDKDQRKEKLLGKKRGDVIQQLHGKISDLHSTVCGWSTAPGVHLMYYK